MPYLIRSANPQYESDPIVRRQAVTGLADLHNTQAVPELIKLLDPQIEKDAEVRRQTAYALGQIPEKRSIEALGQSLDPDKEKSPSVRISAAKSLRMHSPLAVKYLTKALGKERNQGVFLSIVESLGIIGSPESVSPLIDLLRIIDKRQAKVENEIIHALKGARKPRTVDYLARFLNPQEEPNPKVRVYIVRCLGARYKKEAIGYLAEALDPNKEKSALVREEAIWSLEEICDFSVLPTLKRASHTDPSAAVRNYAAAVYRRMKDRTCRIASRFGH